MWILLLHAAATFALVGLIWTIQLAHYPLMDGVGREGFARYHERHAQRLAWLVGPLMPAELALAGWIALRPPAGVSHLLGWTGLGLVLCTWLATAFLAVPAHRRLAHGFDVAAHRRLVRTNWVRTLAWSLRGAIALAMLAAHAG